MLVVDASIIAPLVADNGADGRRYRQRLRGQTLAAPDLMRVECLSVIRRQLSVGDLDKGQATRAVDDLAELPVTEYPTAPLLPRCWQLRDNLTAYDACYAALAEVLDCRLVTADSRLSQAPEIRCEVELL